MKMVKKMLILFVTGFTLVAAPGLSYAQTLVKGSTGHKVTALQNRMKSAGYFHGPVTGYYGPLTKYAVANFQLATGLVPDGIAGPRTFGKLNDVEVMARVVHGEARGESYIGKVAVAAVILNRLDDSRFPKNAHAVIHQTHAFTAVHDGQYDLYPGSTSYRAVIDAMKGWDPTHGSIFYYNPNLATDSWIFSRKSVTRIGNHLFAK
ncbi:cell wall hydrolase [Fictibacillus terranigra]|uniref:Cell wall hydrolase n=1 Tax=Fictibacillus terranigra TaxID=3058424 RepID=A0ABT8E1C6_9BACL|nr:cell wall hydrolase [Fictibacillus sp. CENA-BCM004]MDN4071714.1 cell wall hydrolase [Fictibacillus sp. CENA-BCM004]